MAKNGLEGLDLYHSNKIDIILSDINMPILNGIDMIKEIRKKMKKFLLYLLQLSLIIIIF